MKEAELRMKELGLLSLGMDSLSTLDKWEMPRENIILNRKLGEGAFGTVYGGEAFLEGQNWAAVAVKTLKMGSSIEEKVFLFVVLCQMLHKLNSLPFSLQ